MAHKMTLEVTNTSIVFGVIFFVIGYLVGNVAPVPSTNSGVPVVPSAQVADVADDSAQPQAAKVALEAGDDPVIGNKDAKVYVYEFSDFQCPFCQRFWSDSVKQMEKEYIETGKVAFVYKDFPLEQIHPAAIPAAMYANCANEQGKFKEFHDTVFSSQSLLNQGQSGLDQLASQSGLDMAKLQACLGDANKLTTEIRDDVQTGISLGVSGTPSIFIGSPEKGFIQIVGAQPYSIVKQAIEQQLQ